MRMKIIVIGLGLLCLLSLATVYAEDSSFRVEAPLVVHQKGLIEVTLPLGLHFPSAKGLDLRVLGPEGKTRPFELYWREEKGEATEPVREKSAKLLENGRFRWEGSLEKPLKVRKIQAYLSAGDYIGKVDVFGLQGANWKPLARDAALYQVNGKSWAEISIPEGTYQSFRLEFVSYDQKAKQRLVPLERVEATSETTGKDYAEEVLSLTTQRVDGKEEIQLSASLPGSGLWVKEVDLATAEPFTGEWTLGREAIDGGKKAFAVWRTGRVDSLGKASNVLRIETNEVLNGKTLLLKLRPKNYLGNVKNWKLVLRLPRLVFKADQEGTFKAQAGAGEEVSVLEYPSAENRGSSQAAAWGPAQVNPNWKPESLVEKYHLGGGPFDGKGYAWQAPISLSQSGYYRVGLNQQASLEGHPEGLRVVRQAKQVPYFLTTGETKEIPLPVSESYDQAKNRSTWLIELPQASRNWGDLLLQAEGIFSRTVVFEKPNPGNLAWEPWTQEGWSNREDKKTELRIALGSLPGGTNRVRITIDHGDNRPISLKKVSAFYYAPALCFLADSADGYQLMGGNPTASAPYYDLSLVQNDLLAREPQPVEMGECQPFSGQGMKFKLFRAFDGTNWGLYGVLGLVTLAMIFLLTKLFPAISETKGKKKKP